MNGSDYFLFSVGWLHATHKRLYENTLDQPKTQTLHRENLRTQHLS